MKNLGRVLQKTLGDVRAAFGMAKSNLQFKIYNLKKIYFIKNFKFQISNYLLRLTLISLELGYFFHIRFRKIHDKLFVKKGKYYEYHNTSYPKYIKKTVTISFAISFISFTLLQSFYPYLFSLKPQEVKAGTHSVTWETKGDFESNNVTTGTVTTKNDNAIISGSLFTDSSEVSLTYGMLDNMILAAGSSHSVVIKSNGSLWSWGSGSTALGLGGTSMVTIPTRVGTDSDWKTVSAGSSYNLAVKNDGSLWVWGDNSYGRLGLAGVSSVNIPTRIGNDNNWKTVSAGSYHSVAIKNDGTIWTWGHNGYGQLGLGDTSHRDTPNMVGSQSDWSDIWAGGYDGYYTIAKKNNGTLWAWGRNATGQLGLGDSTQRNTPTQIGTATDWKSASAGNAHVLAIKSDNTLWSWGRNGSGELGLGDTASRNLPTRVGVDSNWLLASAAGSSYYSLAIRTDGTLWGWGSNTYGRAGLGDGLSSSASPLRIGLDSDWKDVLAIFEHSIGQKNNDIVMSWGRNRNARLGIGSSTDYNQHEPINVYSDVWNIYNSPGIISRLLIDSGDSVKSRWANLSWSDNLPTGTAIKFRTRGSDDGSNWPANFDGSSGEGTNSYYEVSGQSITTKSSRYLEVELTLESFDGTNTPTLYDFTVTYDSLEAPQNNKISLQKTNNSFLKNNNGQIITAGISGAWTNETSLKVIANDLSCDGCINSTGRIAEVELKNLDTSEITYHLGSSELTNQQEDLYKSEIILTGLSESNYSLRLRSKDNAGRVSAWTNYGNNQDLQPDFTIDQTPPEGTISINNGNQYTNSTNVLINITAGDGGGSKLSKLYLSNDGENWIDKTPQTGFIGESSFAGDIEWILEEGDGEKNVYLKVVDNAGGVSGRVNQTAKIDFEEGTYSNRIEVKNEGLINLFGGEEEINPNVGINAGCTDIYSRDWATEVKATWGWNLVSASAELIVSGIRVKIYDAGSDDHAVDSETTEWYIGQSAQVCTWGDGANAILNNVFFRAPIAESSTYTSKIFGNNLSKAFEGIEWNSLEDGGSSINIQFRAGNDNTPDDGTGDWTNWSSNLTNGQLLNLYNGKKYFQYRAHLNSGSNQTISPVLYDILINYSYGTQIHLDQTPPTSFTLSSPSTGSWQTNSKPSLSWNPSSDTNGLTKYQLFVNGNLDTDNIDPSTTSIVPTNNLSEGNNTWFVKAIDVAGNETVSNAFNIGLDTGPPGNPTSFNASTTNNDYISINWSYSGDVGSPLTSYALERVTYLEYLTVEGLPPNSWESLGSYRSLTYNHPTQSATHSVGDSNPDENISQGVRYVFRVRAKDTVNQDYGTYSNIVFGSTEDNVAPPVPTNIGVYPCDGVNNCSASPLSNPDMPHKGFETKITWNPSIDSGVGTSHYLIYRSTRNLTSENFNDVEVTTSYGLIGILPYVSGQSPQWYDNDANNDSLDIFFDGEGEEIISVPPGIKTSPSPKLNDYTTYYYRIVAVDQNNNSSQRFPEIKNETFDPLLAKQNGNLGLTSERTPDVTPPTIPLNLTVSPLGLDSSREAQKIDISWSASQDLKSPGRLPEGSGTGVLGYELLFAVGNSSGPTTDFTHLTYRLTTNSNPTRYTHEGLDEYTYYYYKVRAIDKASSTTITDTLNNHSSYSLHIGRSTYSNAVPTVVGDVTVTSTKGDPQDNPNIGKEITVTFTGSYIKYSQNSITAYQIFRSENNLSGDEWKDPTKATLVTTINVNIPGEVQDIQRTYIDTVTKDATTYYYSINTLGINESMGPVESGNSSPTPGTPNMGWDITPDITPPSTPSDLKVKDIHGNTSMVRNIITWAMIDLPQRNGTNDFDRYLVYRYETTQGIISSTLIAEKTNREDNFHVDPIDITQKNIDYSYYVVAKDNASTNFKYPNSDTIINPYSNLSTYQVVSINPGQAKPTVSSIQVPQELIGVSSATITWNTDQPCDSLVEFRVKGESDVIGTLKNRSNQTTTHQVTLVGLAKGTAYQYRIVSKNSLGNIDDLASTTWREFTTQDFLISNVSYTSTTTTATINWNTNIQADSSVEYKLEKIPGEKEESPSTVGDPNFTTTHKVNIKSLKPGRNYTYKVRSITKDKFLAETTFLTFSTKAFDQNQFTIAPDATKVAEENITATSARIVWETSIATTSWVEYGLEPGNYTMSAGDNNLTLKHVVDLKNLTPGNLYYYRVKGRDSSDIEYVSQEYTFTAVLRPEIPDIKVKEVSYYEATITWETNVNTDSQIAYSKDQTLSQRKGLSELKKQHSITLDNLEDNTLYYYQILGRDKHGNEAKSSVYQFTTPLDTTGPEIKDIKIDLLPMSSEDDYAGVIISFTTNKPAIKHIEYGEGIVSGKYDSRTTPDTNPSTGHTIIIRDLNPSTTYNFQIVAKDKRDNETKSQAYSFVTPTKEKSILQLILKSLEESFAWVKNIRGLFRKN